MKSPANPEMNRSAGLSDTLNITTNCYSGNLPTKAIMAFERELFGIEHGQASLTFFIRHGNLHRFTVSREQSVFSEVQHDN